jgi:hypothetical protein
MVLVTQNPSLLEGCLTNLNKRSKTSSFLDPKYHYMNSRNCDFHVKFGIKIQVVFFFLSKVKKDLILKINPKT